MIPYSRQTVTEDDIDAVVAVLRSDFLTQGPAVPQFEADLCTYTGANHAVCVSSATAALHLACLALGLGPGDWLWTSPITFVASANCALYCGAQVDFVDIDPGTWNMSVDALKSKLERAEREGRLPKIVEPVHFAGASCDMQAIRKLADHYGFFVLEDASHALGGKYRGQPVGSCAFSDVTVFSFHPVKPITSAEGGAALTNQPALAEQIALLRTHGVTRDQQQMQRTPHGPWYYEQAALGFNYRMNDVEAALGASQLSRIDAMTTARTQWASTYQSLLSDSLDPPFHCQLIPADVESAWHLFAICLPADLERHRKAIFDRLRDQGYGVNVHYIPLTQQPFFQQSGQEVCPNADAYYSAALTLPLWPGMHEGICGDVVHCLRSVHA